MNNMKIIDMLNKSSANDVYNNIKLWHNFNADSLNNLDTVLQFQAFLEWLNSEYEEPIEDCPFNCKGCSKKVTVQTSDGGDDAECYYTLTAKDPKMQLCCMLDGVYDSRYDAVRDFNRAVKGE